jgi:hypothetical protein
MSAQAPIGDYIRVLRARAERYKRLADGLLDRQMAAEVVACATELEDEIEKLEQRQLIPLGRLSGDARVTRLERV